VWGILGWNIQLYHSHLAITPPGPPDEAQVNKRLGWHQDSGRLNIEMETTPRPRISLKVAFFLTDTTELGRANFYVAPGSHLQNQLTFPADGVSDPEGATPVQVPPGTAVFFDRRLWHAASPNFSKVSRKVLFYGYSYRWLRPRDNMTVSHFMDRCDPIRRQLLGAGTGGFGYTSPSDADVPLKTWIREHLGEAAVAP
jgi:ectoine hydroxylase-related dioxygenase (phytanoyl-CoA dioxygenase family)